MLLCVLALEVATCKLVAGQGQQAPAVTCAWSVVAVPWHRAEASVSLLLLELLLVPVVILNLALVHPLVAVVVL
jgi:hypothetical protein